MKKIYNLFLVSVLFTGALFQSCETIELEQVNNPNNLTEGSPEFFMNQIQSEYRRSQVIFNDRSSELTRIDYMFGRQYLDNYSSTTMNVPWNALYSSMIPDIQAIENAQDGTVDLRLHIGMSKIMQAHLMMQLVDFIGDIVSLEQTNQATEIPNPALTDNNGLTSYNEALALLDEAIALISADDVSSSNLQDQFFGDLENGGVGSDPEKWVKVANTLKMRAAITTKDYTTFNALVAAGNFIESADDDFQFTFGTQQTPVNTQHQDYQADYTPSGSNIYLSNWLMNLMDENADPRIRYYFYRQNDCVPGALEGCVDNPGEVLSCSLQGAPPNLIGTNTEDIWCYLDNGYWGRTHGNDEGGPPDSDLSTAVGVYPAAGRFDDDSFGAITLGQGGNGAGIEPIILSSYVDFWRAEAAMAQGNTMAAAGFIQDGLTKSVAKVQEFAALDGSADTSFEPSGADIDTFITNVVDSFNGASGDDADMIRWNILGEQYFTTLYGGGADAHNFYRRTGYPNTVALNIDPQPGNYPRVFFYPAVEASSNPNVIQRTDFDEEGVFWNVGQSLPIAN